MNFWNKEFPVTLTGEEMRVLWTGAVRYAMHRGTFGSKGTANAVMAHLADIDTGTLACIQNDLTLEIQLLGSESVRYFEDLPDAIADELERRGHERA